MNTLTKPCSKRAKGFSTCLRVMMVLYCTTLLHTCLSTASSLLRCPLVLLLCWLVVACCVTSVAGMFAVHPSFWLIVVFTPLSCLLPPPSPKRRIQHQCLHQRLAKTGIRTLEQQKRGQCRHADRWMAQREQAAEGATRARVDK